MANYTMGLISAQTRVFELKTPSNWVELEKMKNVAVKQWKEDNPGKALADDNITVSVTDDAVHMSWPLSNSVQAAVDPSGCRCGHRWADHSFAGCINRDDPEPGKTFCECVIPRPNGVFSAT